MKLLNLILLILLSALAGYAREIALTIDDLPLVNPSAYSREEEIRIFKDTLDILRRHKLTVVGFINGDKMTESFQDELISQFIREGHETGNHTWSHLDLNLTDTDAYQQDIRRCEGMLSKWRKPGQEKFFRFPCLHRGDTEAKRDTVRKFLETDGFTVVPVSIDHDDYLYNVKFEKARKSGAVDEMKRIAAEYLEHIRERVLHFEAQAQRLTGREIRHIILVHMNLINANYLDELLTWFKEQGWTFISVREALKDEIYRRPDGYVGKKGLSWLERIGQ